ncbi:hypothetical protein TWF506_004456 [Arthrobotrys conoides]|uniref:Uncharacterized protein n=1 Tax=Arthrobotrys conoides TaxID=74498 RepID=A0AAN8N6Q3_9PEZI
MNERERKEYLESFKIQPDDQLLGIPSSSRNHESASTSSSNSKEEITPDGSSEIAKAMEIPPLLFAAGIPSARVPDISPMLVSSPKPPPQPISPDDTYYVSSNPDTCLLVTSCTRPEVRFWVHKSSIKTTSPVLKEYFDSTCLTQKVQAFPGGKKLYFISVIWYHVEALHLLLKVLNHVPNAFPQPQDLSFTTFWQLAATLEYFEIDLIEWFRVYYHYFKEKKMHDGFEGWLVAGRVFGDKEGYAKLSARIILEFTGWEREEMILHGPEGRLGPDGEKVELWSRWGPKNVFDHMKKEHDRLKTSIMTLITNWHAYVVHLKTSRKLVCTCHPAEDCILAARELTATLKQHGLIASRRYPDEDFKGSLLSLRLLFQSLEIRLKRGILGGVVFNNHCKVYGSMAKLMGDIDEVLEGVRGTDYDGVVETFGIQEICRKEMVLPWTMGQVGVGVLCAGVVGMGVGMLAWGGFKMFLRGVGRLEKVIT